MFICVIKNTNTPVYSIYIPIKPFLVEISVIFSHLGMTVKVLINPGDVWSWVDATGQKKSSSLKRFATHPSGFISLISAGFSPSRWDTHSTIGWFIKGEQRRETRVDAYSFVSPTNPITTLGVGVHEV